MLNTEIKYEAILFDFDGTIADTEPAIIDAFRYVFRKYRCEEEFTSQVLIDVLGPPLEESMRKYFPDRNPKAMVREFDDYQLSEAIHHMKMMDGAAELVEWIRNKGLKTGLVSSRLRASMEVILRHFHYKNLFDVVIGIEDLQRGKPDPEGIIKAMNCLESSNAVYVGDSPTDIIAGKHAGISTVAYCSNAGKKEALLAENPDYFVSSLSEFLGILETQ